jgi:hypothetical protein
VSDSRTVVKKVSAFPFPAQFKSETAAFTGKIVKLSKTGFLAEVTIATLQPLEKMECTFQFPVLQKAVIEQVVVVKIYNHYVPATQSERPLGQSEKSATSTASAGAGNGAEASAAVVHLVEMHFKSPSLASQDAVQSFLAMLERHK